MKEAAIRMKMDMTPVDSLVPVDMVAGVGRCGCESVCVLVGVVSGTTEVG